MCQRAKNKKNRKVWPGTSRAKNKNTIKGEKKGEWEKETTSSDAKDWKYKTLDKRHIVPSQGARTRRRGSTLGWSKGGRREREEGQNHQHKLVLPP